MLNIHSGRIVKNKTEHCIIKHLFMTQRKTNILKKIAFLPIFFSNDSPFFHP